MAKPLKNALKAFAFTFVVVLGAGLLPFVTTGATMALTSAAITAVGTLLGGLLSKGVEASRDNFGTKVSTRNATAPRQIVYGQCRVGGTITHIETLGSENEKLTMVVALAGHEIESLEKVFINDEELETTTSGGFKYATNQKFINSDNDNAFSGGYLLRYRFLDGSQTTGDSTIANNSSLTTNDKFTSVAIVFIQMIYDSEAFGGGIPPMAFVIKGKKVYDPRKAGHTFGTESTYEWSDNPALHLLDYLTNTTYGLKATADEFLETDTVGSFLQAANHCDVGNTITTATVNGAVTSSTSVVIDSASTNTLIDVGHSVTGTGISGTVKVVKRVSNTLTLSSAVSVADGVTLTFNEVAYTSNGFTNMTADGQGVIEGLLSSCAGKLSYINGKFVMFAGVNRSATLSINDDNLLAPIQITTKQTTGETFNSVKSIYVDANNKYVATDSPTYEDSTFLSQDTPSGESSANYKKVLELQLPFTDTNTMAQRLQKSALLHQRKQVTVNVLCNINFLKLQPNDWVYVTNERLSYTNKTFEVLSTNLEVVDSDGVQVLATRLALKEIDNTVYTFSSSNYNNPIDEGTSVSTGDFSVSAPTGLSVSATLINTGYDLNVQWTNIADDNIQGTEILYGTSSGTYTGSVITGKGIAKEIINNVKPNTTYYIVARHFSNNNVFSSYTSEVTINTNSDSGITTPSAPTSLSATTGKPLSIGLSWTNPSNSDLRDIQIYRSTSSGFTPDDNTNLVRTIAGVPSVSQKVSFGIDDGLVAGTTYYFKVKAVSFFDKVSTASSEASGSFTKVEATDIEGIFSGYFHVEGSTTTALSDSAFNTAHGRLPIEDDILIMVNTSASPKVSKAYKYSGTAGSGGSFVEITNFTTGDLIAGETIAGNKLIANTITATQIATDTITANEIASNTITASQIASNTITATQIASSTITATEMNVSNLSSISADIGTITSGSLNIGSGAFTVSSAGVLSATGATVSGSLIATSLNVTNATITGTLDASVITLDGEDLSTLIGFGATSPNASGDYFNFTGKVDFSDDVVFDDSVGFYSGVVFAAGWNGQGIFDIDQGALEFGSYTPSSTTNRLYNVGGTLHWNGSQVGVGAVNSVNNMVNNRVITASGSNSINGEANLTFDGSTLTVTGNQVVTGDLTVQGTTTTIDTTNLDVADKNITLNYGTGDTSANANGAGITIQDAVNSTTDATILWDTANDEFDFSHPINTSGITSTGNVAASGTVSGQALSVSSSGYGALELGGVSGAFIDLKRPNSDDFDLRLITTGTGGQIVAPSGATIDMQIVSGTNILSVSNTGINVTGNIVVSGTVDGRDVATDGSKLDGIEAGATTDQTQSEINALGITAIGLSGSPNITVGTISSGAITSTGNSTFSGVIGVGGTSTNSSYGVYLQNNKWYATQYSSSHDVVRINANTAGGLDIYNQTDNGFANVRVGSLNIGGTTVIDSSRNLTNIGTISSGAIEIDTTNPQLTFRPDDGILFRLRVDESANRLEIGHSSNKNLYLSNTGNATFNYDLNVSGDLDVTGTISSGDITIADGTTYKQSTDMFYIGGDGLAGSDAAIYLGNRGNGTGYGWRFYYEGSGNGNNNKLTIKSENLGSPVDALSFTQDGNATFSGTISSGAITSSGVVKATQYEPYSSTASIHYKGYASRNLIQAVDGAAYYYGSDNASYAMVIQGGNPILKTVKIGSVNAGTTVIDSSRNLTNIADATITGEVGIGVAPASTWKARIQSQYPLQILSNTGATTYELYAQESGIKEFRIFNSAKVVGYNQNLTLDTNSSSYQVQLATNGSTKLTTTSTGIDVTGTITADGLDLGDNSVLNVDTIALDKIKGDADDNTNITFAGSDTTTFTQGGSQVMSVNTTGLTVTGTISSGSITSTSSITANSGGNEIVLGTDGNIEITRTGSGAYIDFKNSTSEDYDQRIQATSTGHSFSGTISSGNITVNTTSSGNQLTLQAPTPSIEFIDSQATSRKAKISAENGNLLFEADTNTGEANTAITFKMDGANALAFDSSKNATFSNDVDITGNLSVSNNLDVGDELTVDGISTFYGDIQAEQGTKATFSEFHVGSNVAIGIEISNLTTTSTTQTSRTLGSASTYRTFKLMVQATSGTSYHATEILLTHDGTTVYMTEYGTIFTGLSLATFDADISSGNVRLLVDPSQSASTVFKFSLSAIKV